MYRLKLFIAVALCVGLMACGGSSSNTSSVTISDRWNLPKDLTTDAISVAGQDVSHDNNTPLVVTDNSGNVIVVWRQWDGANQRIYMSEYRDGVWIHPTDLSTDAISFAGSNAYHPRVAMDNNGNAIVVWDQRGFLAYSVYMSEYRNGHWTHPTDVAADAISIVGQAGQHENADSPTVAMNDNGIAIIAWDQSDGTNRRIYKSEYRNGAWTHPTDFNTDTISIDGSDASNPEVAIDDNDDIVIAWEQRDGGTNFQVFMSEYRNGTWTHPTDFNTDAISIAAPDVYYPRVSMANNGDALIIWTQGDNADYGSYQVFMSEYRNGSWMHPTDFNTDAISIAGSFPFVHKVAMADNGDALITWTQTSLLGFGIYLSEYRNNGWTHPSDLTADAINPMWSAGQSSVAIDNNGDAIITWEQSDGSNHHQIYMSEFRNNSWGSSMNMTTGAISVVDQEDAFPHVAMSDNGTAIIVWLQSDGTNLQVYMSEYR